MTCSGCNQLLTDPRTAALQKTPPEPDDLWVCSCGTINVICEIGCRPLTQEEFDSAPEDVRKELDFARRALKTRVTGLN